MCRFGLPLPAARRLIHHNEPTGGFTSQYAELQQLQDKYGAKGFTVLAFPCNRT